LISRLTQTGGLLVFTNACLLLNSKSETSSPRSPSPDYLRAYVKNPKSEYRNPKQIQISKIQMFKTLGFTLMAQINADFQRTKKNKISLQLCSFA